MISDRSETLVSALERVREGAQEEKVALVVSAYERIMCRNLGVGCAWPTFTDEAVTSLVNPMAATIGRDAARRIRPINAAEEPHQDQENPEL